MQSCQCWLLVAQAQALMFIVSSITIGECPHCGSGWRRVGDEDFCYSLNTSPDPNRLNFYEAQNYCQKSDGAAGLPILKMNRSRGNFKALAIAEAPIFSQFYIGLQKSWSEWTWLDGTSQDITLFEDKIEDSKNLPNIYLFWNGQKATYSAFFPEKVQYVYCQKKCPLSTSTSIASTHTADGKGRTTDGMGQSTNGIAPATDGTPHATDGTLDQATLERGQATDGRGQATDGYTTTVVIIVGVAAVGFILILALSFLITTIYQRKRQRRLKQSVSMTTLALPPADRGQSSWELDAKAQDQASISITPSDTLYGVPGLDAYSHLDETDRTETPSDTTATATHSISRLPTLFKFKSRFRPKPKSGKESEM